MFEILGNPWVHWSLVTIYSVSIVSIVCLILSENRNPVKSLAWLTVLLLVPAFGLVLYVVFGRNIKNKRIISRRNRKRLKKIEEQGTTTDLRRVDRSDTSKHLIRLGQSLTNANFHEGNDATVFDNGTDKFEALLADIEGAKRFIHMQYYILADDSIGQRLADALIRKAGEGVAVRVIYDHVGSFKAKNRYFKRMRAAGIQVYPFFKVVFPPFGTRINWRNHRKLCVIDGRVGYIGGMNVADRYVDGGKFNRWRDLHMRLTGPAVAALQHSFAVDWNFMGQPLVEESSDMRPAPTAAPMGMQLITAGPTDQWANIAMMFQTAISSARKCVYIQTPYFLPTEALLHALQAAALARIDVRIMMPRRSDSDMLRLASFSYVTECLRSGIKIYLYTPGMLHSKAIIIDDDIASIGSTNFDFRSFEHNFESNMFVYSKEFNAKMKEVFFRDQDDCVRVLSSHWSKRPLLQRILESFMRIFAPIL